MLKKYRGVHWGTWFHIKKEQFWIPDRLSDLSAKDQPSRSFANSSSKTKFNQQQAL